MDLGGKREKKEGEIKAGVTVDLNGMRTGKEESGASSGRMRLEV